VSAAGYDSVGVCLNHERGAIAVAAAVNSHTVVIIDRMGSPPVDDHRQL